MAAANQDRRVVRQTVRTVLAASYACAEQDFVQEGVVIVDAAELPDRLRFPVWSKPLLIGTMGAGVVVSCHADRMTWLQAKLDHRRRDVIFSAPIIGELASYVEHDGQYLTGPNLKYACSEDDFRQAAAPDRVEVALVEGDDIAELYRYHGFAGSLTYRPDSPRPNIMATVARRDGEVIGIAAASADSEMLWQIGVEVAPAARGAGVGRALVSRVTEGILGKGKIPYYTTAVSNIHSRAIALGLGYWPAWVELYARDREGPHAGWTGDQAGAA